MGVGRAAQVRRPDPSPRGRGVRLKTLLIRTAHIPPLWCRHPAQGCRNSSQSHRPSVELIYYCIENAVVYLVKYLSMFKPQAERQSRVMRGTLYLRKVTHAAKQGVAILGVPVVAGYFGSSIHIAWNRQNTAGVVIF